MVAVLDRSEYAPTPTATTVSIEAGSTDGWTGLVDLAIGLDRFGDSGPGDQVMAHHGFTVDAPTDRGVETDLGAVEVSHVCLNDGVVEGLVARDVRAFSVQYHPEAAAGPHDAAYLFDRFVELLDGEKGRA